MTHNDTENNTDNQEHSIISEAVNRLKNGAAPTEVLTYLKNILHRNKDTE